LTSGFKGSAARRIRHDAIDFAHLDHRGVVDPQDRVEQRAVVNVLRLAVGVDGNCAVHARIDDVVDLQALREDVDDFAEGGVLQG
jgi:hypothetical protein